MANKSVVFDDLERMWVTESLQNMRSVLTRKINTEKNAAIKDLRAKELVQLEAVLSKVQS